MAKRRKLNTRLVLILVLVVVILMLGGAYGAYKTRLYRKIFPKNPEACLRIGEAAIEKGDYEAAEKAVGESIIYAKDPSSKAEHLYRYAKLMYQWLNAKSGELTQTKQRELFDRAYSALYNATLNDSTHVGAQEMLTDRAWGLAPRQGQWLGFIKEADNLLRLKPDDHETVFMRALAWSELARGVPGTNTENAIADFRRAIELKGDEPRYHLQYTLFLQQEQRWDEALAAYEQAVTKLPNNADLRVRYGYLLISRDRAEEGMNQIGQAIERDPNSTAGHIAMGEQMLMKRDVDAAMESLEKARQIDESDYRVYYMISRAYLQRKDIDKCISSLRDGLDRIEARLASTSTTSQADKSVREGLMGNRWHLIAVLANTYLDEATRAQGDAAKTHIDEARKLLGDEKEWPDAFQAQASEIAGRLAYLDGDIDRALPLLEQAYRILGPDPAITGPLVTIYIRKNLPGNAEQILDVMRRNPAYTNSPQVLLTKAQLEMNYRNFDQAQQFVDQVLKADPENAEAKRLKVALDAARGKVTVEETLTGEEPSQPVVGALLSRVSNLWAEGDRDGAIALLEQLHKKLPANRSISSDLLGMYVNTGNIAQAKALIGELKAASPETAGTLELQEKLIDEKDPAKRQDLMMQIADTQQDPVRRALAKASICAAYGQTDQQGQYLQEAYQAAPKNPAVVQQVFRYALAREDWSRAEEMVKVAAVENIDQFNGKIFSAQLAMARRQYPQAIEILTQAIGQKSDSKTPWVLMGQCYLDSGDLAKAEKTFLTVLKADPAHVPSLVAMAMITGEQGKAADHAGWIERAYRLVPNNTYVKEQYLLIAESKGNTREAITQRERIYQGNPADLDNCVRLARLYEQVGQLDRAEKLYAFVQANTPNKLMAARELAAFYARNGRNAEADRVLVAMLQDWQDKVAAYLVYAEFLAKTKPDEARRAVDKAIETDPNDPRGPRALVSLLVAAGDWAGASQALDAYLKLSPDDTSARQDLIRYQVRAGQFDQARQQIDASLATNPNDADLLAIKGDLVMAQGDVAKGLEAYDTALRVKPDHVAALVGQARAYLAQGKMPEAQQSLTKAKAASNNPTIIIALASLYEQLGDHEKAQMYLREVLQQADQSQYATAMRMLLDIYKRQQRWPKVAELLAEARAKFPNEPGYLLDEAELYSRTGNKARAVQATEAALKLTGGSSGMVFRTHLLALLDAGEYAKALAVIDGAKDSGLVGPVEQSIRARAMVKLNQTAQADEQFIAALKGGTASDLMVIVSMAKEAYGLNTTLAKMGEWMKSRPNESSLYYMLGLLHNEAKDYPKAAEAFAKTASLADKPAIKAMANREMGLAYYQMRKLPEAEQAYLASLESNPNDPATLNNLAYMYTTDMDQAAKALPYAARATKSAPGDANILDTYGWSLAKAASYSEAERVLQLAIQSGSDPATAGLARYHLAWVYEHNGQPAEAIRQYRQAGDTLKDQPDSEAVLQDISQALSRLQNAQTMNQ